MIVSSFQAFVNSPLAAKPNFRAVYRDMRAYFSALHSAAVYRKYAALSIALDVFRASMSSAAVSKPPCALPAIWQTFSLAARNTGFRQCRMNAAAPVRFFGANLHDFRDCSVLVRFKTDPAYYPDKLLPERAADTPASPYNTAGIPEPARCPAPALRF